MPRGSAIGCKTASRPGPRARHHGDRGVHAQRRYDQRDGDPQPGWPRVFIPTENEWYKAAYYKIRRDQRGLLDLSHAEQHRADQHPALDTGNTMRTSRQLSAARPLHRPDELPDAGGRFAGFAGVPTGRMTWAATSCSGTRRNLRFVSGFAWRVVADNSDNLASSSALRRLTRRTRTTLSVSELQVSLSPVASVVACRRGGVWNLETRRNV